MAFSRSSQLIGLGDDGSEANNGHAAGHSRSSKAFDEHSKETNDSINSEDCLTLDFGPFERYCITFTLIKINKMVFRSMFSDLSSYLIFHESMFDFKCSSMA